MSILQWDREFALEQAADDQELLQELLDIFKTSFTEDMEKMRNGLSESDSQQVSAAAHSIKGASASLGIVGVSQLAKQIEIQSKRGNLKDSTPLVDQLQLMLDELAAL